MFKIRKATMNDFEFYYKLKCEKNSVKWSGFEDKPNKDNLYIWFKRCVELEEIKKQIFIIEDLEDIGYIRIDTLEDKSYCDIPIGICERYLGKGYASRAIMLGLEEAKRQGYKAVHGWIREDNIASIKAYQNCGGMLSCDYKEVNVSDKSKSIKMYKLIIEL